jgi:hypothetical protein
MVQTDPGSVAAQIAPATSSIEAPSGQRPGLTAKVNDIQKVEILHIICLLLLAPIDEARNSRTAGMQRDRNLARVPAWVSMGVLHAKPLVVLNHASDLILRNFVLAG